uniref:Uncharacterized protein n=1 Tax=Monodelphis domestica TaxID=13616 RepID=A0A5F8H1K4_MONDO
MNFKGILFTLVLFRRLRLTAPSEACPCGPAKLGVTAERGLDGRHPPARPFPAVWIPSGPAVGRRRGRDGGSPLTLFSIRSLHETRSGDICNACVLLVKRWKKLPAGSKKNWNHVVDARAGPSLKTTLKPKKVKTLSGSRIKSNQINKLQKEFKRHSESEGGALPARIT